MSDIKDFGFQEETLEEFKGVWEEYRNMAYRNISQMPDIHVRDLFVQLSMMQAHAEMRIGILESRRDAKKLQTETKRSLLLATKYKTGAMNSRVAQVESDSEYLEFVDALEDAEHKVIIGKAIARATTIAANSLSREMSARMKN